MGPLRFFALAETPDAPAGTGLLHGCPFPSLLCLFPGSSRTSRVFLRAFCVLGNLL